MPQMTILAGDFSIHLMGSDRSAKYSEEAPQIFSAGYFPSIILFAFSATPAWPPTRKISSFFQTTELKNFRGQRRGVKTDTLPERYPAPFSCQNNTDSISHNSVKLLERIAECWLVFCDVIGVWINKSIYSGYILTGVNTAARVGSPQP